MSKSIIEQLKKAAIYFFAWWPVSYIFNFVASSQHLNINSEINPKSFSGALVDLGATHVVFAGLLVPGLAILFALGMAVTGHWSKSYWWRARGLRSARRMGEDIWALCYNVLAFLFAAGMFFDNGKFSEISTDGWSRLGFVCFVSLFLLAAFGGWLFEWWDRIANKPD